MKYVNVIFKSDSNQSGIYFIAPRQIETKEVIEMDEERQIQIRQWLV